MASDPLPVSCYSNQNHAITIKIIRACFNKSLSTVAQGSVALGIVFSYALQFYVVVDLLWREIQERYAPLKKPVLYELLLRVFLTLITFILAVIIPQLELFISLIGAISSTTLALVYPALCDIAIRTSPPEDNPLKTKFQIFRFICDTVTLIVALLGFIFGTYFSGKAIFNAFSLDGTAQKEEICVTNYI